MELIATATFGLEAVVKREVENLGYKILRSEDGKITFEGDELAIAKSNLWLRSADRVLVKMGEFKAESFEELFQNTKKLPWEDWIPVDGKFIISGSSVRSQLHSVPDCQSIVEKAIVERLKGAYEKDWFDKTGADFAVKVTILKDTVTLTIDTSGQGLHKRGYRIKDVQAPIKETLAAALVQLSFWREGRLLVDPFCGSGTIVIEAAMIGKNIAPGVGRRFAAEGWPCIQSQVWKDARKEAFEAVKNEADVKIIASDIDKRAIMAARENAIEAGVEDCIDFKIMAFNKFVSDEKSGIIVTNPPYGERIGEKDEIEKIYTGLGRFFKEKPDWSLFLITADKEFEYKFSRKKADRKRKLYNGRLETTYFQYHGIKQ